MPAKRRLRAAVALAAIALAGCGSGDETEVREVAKEFFTQASAGGSDACKLASKRYAGSADGCLEDARAFGEESDKIEPVEAVNEIEIDGEKATARVVSAGTRLRGAMLLVNEDGAWRFDGIDPSAL